MRSFIFIVWFTLFTAQSAYAGPLAGVIGGFLMDALINAVVGAIVGAVFGGSKSKSRGAQESRGVLVNKNSNNEPIPVMYGRARTGGTRVYMETSDGAGNIDATNILNIVLVMTEGQQGNLKKIWFNDVVVFDGDATHEQLFNDNVTSENGNTYAGTAEFQYFDGRDSQVVSSLMQTSVGNTVWTNTAYLNGLCYLAIKLTADPEKYGGGVPLITCEMDGKVIKDISTGLDYSGSDQNPVDVLYDYLTNTRYGKGIDPTKIDMTTWLQARTDVGAKYPVNGPIFTDLKLYENVNTITDTMNGLLIYTAGTYKLKIKKQGEPVTRTVDNDSIIGNINISGDQKAQRLNKITINYANQAKNYNDDVYILQDGTLLALDKNVTLERSVDLDLITDENKLAVIAQYYLDASRYNVSLDIECPHTLLTSECGDIIGITHDALGYNNKTFRIQKMEITAENTVKLNCSLYKSEIQI